MSAPVQQKRYTPDDLLEMPDGDRFELVNGQLVEKDVSFLSNYVAGRLFRRIDDHNSIHKLGWPTTDGTTFRCFRDRSRVRKPDGSFISLARFTIADAVKDGHVVIVPDLIIEVVSPKEIVYDLEGRIFDFLQAGTRLMWVVYPVQRAVRIHRPNGTATLLSEHDELSGEDVIPEFRCKIRDLFLSPTGELLETPATPVVE